MHILGIACFLTKFKIGHNLSTVFEMSKLFA